MGFHNTQREVDPQGDRGRLYAELNRLETDLERLRAKLASPNSAAAPQITANNVKRIIRARRAREEILGTDLFADPAWDMLLASYLGEILQTRMSVSELCEASAVPATTALRWLQELQDQGWLRRKNDPLHGRRVWVELTPQGSVRLAGYFAVMSSDLLGV